MSLVVQCDRVIVGDSGFMKGETIPDEYVERIRSHRRFIDWHNPLLTEINFNTGAVKYKNRDFDFSMGGSVR